MLFICYFTLVVQHVLCHVLSVMSSSLFDCLHLSVVTQLSHIIVCLYTDQIKNSCTQID